MKVHSIEQPQMKRVREILTTFLADKPSVADIPFFFSSVYGREDWNTTISDILIRYDVLDPEFLEVPLTLEDFELKQEGRFIRVSVRVNDHLYFMTSQTMFKFNTSTPLVTTNPYAKYGTNVGRGDDDGILNSTTMETGLVLNLVAKNLFLLKDVWEEHERGLFVIKDNECLITTKQDEKYYTIETSSEKWIAFLLLRHVQSLFPHASKSTVETEVLHRMDLMHPARIVYVSDVDYNLAVRTFYLTVDDYPLFLNYLKENCK